MALPAFGLSLTVLVLVLPIGALITVLRPFRELPKSRRADLLDVEAVPNVLAFCSERIGEVFGTFGRFVRNEREKQGAAAITGVMNVETKTFLTWLPPCLKNKARQW